MKRLGQTLALVLVIALGLSFGLGAGAQTDPDQDALDAIRAEIPEGFPGKYDLQEGQEKFGKLVSLYGESTAVPDFGTGSQLTGLCGGMAFSYDENGVLLMAVADFGDSGPPIDLLNFTQAFTSSNPFRVDPRGVVTYYGFSPEEGDGPEDHRWKIRTSGISLDSGGDPNPLLKNRNVGIVDLDKDLPVKFTAKVRISGEMMSKNQPDCVGKGHVLFLGNGLTDPVGIAGLALLGGGIFGLLFNSRPAFTYKSSGA